jgi:hypothetical protein
MEKKRQLIYFKNYYKNFFNQQTEKVKDKIDYVLYLVNEIEKALRIKNEYFELKKGGKNE